TRIAATANAVGVRLELVTREQAIRRLSEPGVSLVIVDLNGPAGPALVGDLKRAVPAVPIVGFFSHVDTALKRDALAAGADAVLPRSQFVVRMPALLERGLAALAPADREDLRL